MYTHTFCLYKQTYIYTHIFRYVGTCIYKFTHMYTNIYHHVCVCVCLFFAVTYVPSRDDQGLLHPLLQPPFSPVQPVTLILVHPHHDTPRSPLFFVYVLIFIYIYTFPPLCHAGALTRVTAHTGGHIWRDLKSPTSRRCRVSHYALLPCHERHTTRRAAICGSGLDT